MVFEEPDGASAFAGHVLTRPLKHTSVEAHGVQVVAPVSLKPGLHRQALESREPVGEVKFAGHVISSSAFPPGQYASAVQMGQGLVPALEPFPKYPGAQRHWFCVVESTELRLLVGHSFLAPATHHELLGHDVQMLPSR